ncbi:MAG: septal ring lytic transglycosylase RlpA family protein [Bacteroidetes bacterium]|nr:septal ring lytic transglycosylase RlpA family protein [Bacteroidota bacterium]
MKKTVVISVLLGGLHLGFSQTVSPKDKAKTTVSATAVVKDTVNKEKAPLVQPEIVFNDTVIAIKGKYKLYKKGVHASYYANKFNGRRTASGKRFDNNKYSAAHRKFPFGTILRITNEETGKFVFVEVTDRGPFSRGREIDLSKKAFMEIAPNKNSGSMLVKIEEVN